MISTFRRNSLAGAGVALTAALASCAAPATTPADATSSSPTAAPTPIGTGTPAPTTDADGEYADGEYSADGWYGGLPSSIGVTLTLADDIVTAVEVTPHATNPTSLDLQERFAAAIPDVVVGRNISELNIDRLAGSSGTPVGFNDAIDQIQAQAERN